MFFHADKSFANIVDPDQMIYSAASDLGLYGLLNLSLRMLRVNPILLPKNTVLHFSWMRVRLVIRRLWVRPPPGRQHAFVEIDHEIFSTVILYFPLIQEGQLSVSGERMCTILVNRLED